MRPTNEIARDALTRPGWRKSVSFVLARVRVRRWLRREQHVHLLAVPNLEREPDVPRATAKPSRDESAKSSQAGMRNPDTRNRRNLSLRRGRGVKVDV